MSDRRVQVRYDVVGALWGQLELDEQTRVRNVSMTGVLVDSSVAPALDAEQTVRVLVDGQSVTIDARVKHVRPVSEGSGTPRYLVGLEFMSLPISVLQSIEQLAAVPTPPRPQS